MIPPPMTAAVAAAPTRPILTDDALELVQVSLTKLPVPEPRVIRVTEREPAARKLSAEHLCMSESAQRECQAAFAAALQSAILPAGVVEENPDAAEPLRFHKRAAWIRKLETIGKEGIPFVRVPRGPDNELVLGIDRNGVLGFSLQKTSR
jgi:hypothetical protein